MRNKFLCLLFVVPGLFTGCSGGQSHEIRVMEVSAAEWSNSSPVDVFFDNPDSLQRRTVEVLVRFRNDFPYDRLDLVLQTMSPDSLVWRDTLSVSFQPAAGEAVSLTYTDLKIPYRSGSQLDRTGTYRFRFTPLMPASYIEEVIGLGVEITTQ